MKTLLLAVSILMVIAGSLSAAEVPGVGDRAPDFSLPGSDGKTHSLADYRGRPVVIAWFPKAFTSG